MNRILFFVDEISTWVGKTVRLVHRHPHLHHQLRGVRRATCSGAPTDWAFDASYMLYGTLFMMAGAYTLSRNGHVRGDFHLSRLVAAHAGAMDLVLYILFFFPGHAAPSSMRATAYAELSLDDERAFLGEPDRPAGLSVQDADPDRRRA